MKSTRRSTYLNNLLYLFTTLIFSACQAVPAGLDEPTATLLATSSLHPTATPQATQTFLPTAGYPPTLEPEEARQKLVSLMHDNGNCQLPCIWGMTPGETTWQEASELLLPFGSAKSEGSLYVSVEVSGTYGEMISELRQDKSRAITHIYYQQSTDERLEAIKIEGSFLIERVGYSGAMPMPGEGFRYDDFSPGDRFGRNLAAQYLPQQILRTHGRPSQILICPEPEDPARKGLPAQFDMVLVYEEIGFLAHYRFPRLMDAKNYTGCPKFTYEYGIVTWDPKREIDLVKLSKYLDFGGIGGCFQPIEKVTNWTAANFVRHLLEEYESTCIYMPKSEWRP